VDLSQIATNLILKEDGIYYIKSNSLISYPELGYDLCFNVEEESFWFEHRKNVILSAVRRFLSKGQTFLDVGGSNGYHTITLQNEGYSTIMIEPGERGIKHAKERGVRNLICADFSSIDFCSRFDGIGLFDLLEHISDTDTFLHKVYDLLKPGGKLFISVPAYQFLWSATDERGGHFRRYTLNSLGEELRSNGFSQIYQTYLFFPMVPIVFLLKTIPSRLGRGEEVKARAPKYLKRKHSINKILINFEFMQIERKRSIPFGTSCFMVAEVP
jgi:SAM-dependent methyltransferase